MKILLVIYSCAPNSGSENGVGWNMLRTLSRHHEVVVVTRGTFRESIERQNLQEQGHNVRFVYVNNLVHKESWLNRKLFQPIYYLWHLRAARKVRKLTKAESFNIVQHVNWIRCWMPSAILGAASGKLVWGPVGGVESLPDAFLRGWEYGRFREGMKKRLVSWVRLDPFLRALGRKADIGFATTRESQSYMQKLGCPTELMSEIALTDQDVAFLSGLNDEQESGIRFVSMGRLLGWKGFHYGIRAFAEANIPDSQYWIIGDGPAAPKLKALVNELDIEDRVCFLGQLDRQECLDRLSKCQVLVHPSLRDSGGWVCLEAMAARKPVICLARGGPAINVTSESGTIVPAQSPDQVVRDITLAMTTYAADPQLVQSHGEAGLARVRENFTWETKYQSLLRHYEHILGQTVVEPATPVAELVRGS